MDLQNWRCNVSTVQLKPALWYLFGYSTDFSKMSLYCVLDAFLIIPTMKDLPQ